MAVLRFEYQAKFNPQTLKEGTNFMEKMFTNMTGGGPVSVYVEDGRITRVRPLQIPEEDFPAPWVIEGNDGKKYSPPKAFRLRPPVHGE